MIGQIQEASREDNSQGVKANKQPRHKLEGNNSNKQVGKSMIQ